MDSYLIGHRLTRGGSGLEEKLNPSALTSHPYSHQLSFFFVDEDKISLVMKGDFPRNTIYT